VVVDGILKDNTRIHLVDDRQDHQVVVELGG
jgi:hypothetical protein